MNNTLYSFAAAVVIGRMQLYHRGHETLLRRALELAPTVIVVLGSSFRSRNVSNPFTWQERRAMIEATLTPRQLERVRFVPVRDYYDDERWNACVRQEVARHHAGHGDVALVGLRKDSSSYYLGSFPDWKQHAVDKQADIAATSLRKVFFESKSAETALAVLEPYVSPAVAHYLQAWSKLPVYERMRREAHAVEQGRLTYGPGPHLAADALVQVGEHVLLVRRAGDVGHGQWAVPGGFVELDEHTLGAALRELREETCFPWLPEAIRRGYRGEALFQDPRRSPRGRILSHAFHFRFADMPLPEVHAADDASEARWVHVSELAGMQELLFEDHAVILERFVGGVLGP